MTLEKSLQEILCQQKLFNAKKNKLLQTNCDWQRNEKRKMLIGIKSRSYHSFENFRIESADKPGTY